MFVSLTNSCCSWEPDDERETELPAIELFVWTVAMLEKSCYCRPFGGRHRLLAALSILSLSVGFARGIISGECGHRGE